ncbi:MAG: hypothetical protein A3J48_02760 [Candidatus Doudnabacteria bacterium RIFCSPHIGHO2_02_FULL_46_11]|uniref:Cyclase n=1 Tax=Candidatus Doudnabacteria bacterium RIFCSPHIGHO2_02_FULL_46_11 TaxID=1817832 RepID=A0A1F5P5B7_9BACT|nr:MAG: hypothetical protein A3J48_02760 [Candidatus Doudnabacteria bacterium RIFCSPHIGHO2_02_FULL_46_11]
MSKIVDLTHTFKENMPVYPGDTPPELYQTRDLAKNGYTYFQLNSGMHVGTHIDAPLHMIADGQRIDSVSPEKFIGRGVIVDARGVKIITADLFKEKIIKAGDIVLVFTGFSDKYDDPHYFTDFPVIDENFAKKMVELGIKMLGTDTPSPDKEPYNVHKILLGHNVLIIENLTNLGELLEINDFEVIALPVKIDAEAALARVIARYEN